MEHQDAEVRAALIRNALVQNGFSAAGYVIQDGGAVRIAGNRFVATHSSARERFARGAFRVTVGPRTTCIYRIGEQGPTDFQNFKSRHVADIVAALARLEKPETLNPEPSTQGGA